MAKSVADMAPQPVPPRSSNPEARGTSACSKENQQTSSHEDELATKSATHPSSPSETMSSLESFREGEGNKSNAEKLSSLITISLRDKTDIRIPEALLMKYSQFFNTIITNNQFSDSVTHAVELPSLNPCAARAVLTFILDDQNNSSSLTWDGFDWNENNNSSVNALRNVMEYLQINDGALRIHETLYALKVLAVPNFLSRELTSEGYFNDSGRLVHLPRGKENRIWKFFVYMSLVLNVLPMAERRTDGVALAKFLGELAPDVNVVELRHDFVEEGLLRRRSDGSEYWRPAYTAEMIVAKMKGGVPRKVI